MDIELVNKTLESKGYILKILLGNGAFGFVYLVEDMNLRKE